MTNTETLKAAIKKIEIDTKAVRIMAFSNTVKIFSKGLKEDKKLAMWNVSIEIANELKKAFPGRKVLRRKLGGGSYRKSYEMSCDKAPNQWETQIFVQMTQAEKEKEIYGGRW